MNFISCLKSHFYNNWVLHLLFGFGESNLAIYQIQIHLVAWKYIFLLKHPN